MTPRYRNRRQKNERDLCKLGLTAFAAARALNVTVKEENGKAVQQVSVEPTKKEAHKIEVTADMSRRDMFIRRRAAYRKIPLDATDGRMTIVPLNAAEVYWHTMLGDGWIDAIYDEDAFAGTTELNGIDCKPFSRRE